MVGVFSPNEIKDQERVRVGNKLARFSFKIFDLCRRLGKPCILENPATSMLWVTPPAVRLLSRPDVCSEITHFCQWGKPWRKATRLMHTNLDSRCADLLIRKCHGRNGQCSRTGLPHQVLSGVSPDGRFWTLVAQPYPPMLCSQLAKCLKGYA